MVYAIKHSMFVELSSTYGLDGSLVLVPLLLTVLVVYLHMSSL